MTNEQIIARIQSGRGNAKDLLTELYENNVGFIKQISTKYHSRVNPSEYDDLEQECFIGLYEALQRYDFNCDTSFLTFASYYCKKNIVQFIRHKTTVLRLPNEQIDLISKYRKYTLQVMNNESRKPTDKEYRDFLGISQKRLNAVRDLSTQIETRSLNETVSDDEGAFEIINTIPDESNIESDIINAEYEREIKSVLWDEVDDLDEKDSFILRERYLKNKTLVEIGRDLGMTKEGARQRESRALSKLKRNLRVLNLVKDSDFCEQSSQRVGLRFYLNNGSSSVEWAVMQIDRNNERKQRVETRIDNIIDYQKEIIRGNRIKQG